MLKKAKNWLRVACCGTAIIPHSALRTSKSNGFTLVEIVITIVLIGILSGVAAMIIMQGVRAYSDEQSRSDVHYQARLAVERMAREIRQIRSRTDISTWTDTNMRFTDASGNVVGFEHVGSNINRWDGATDTVLASGITPFDYNYFQQDGTTPAGAVANIWFVEITFTSQQGSESAQMRTKVHPRNF